MLRTRVIPCLLLKDRGLVKTINFKKPTYLGDPINTVKIFNEKEVDELIFLDITATNENRPPNFNLIKKITDECFMPLGVGGGITKVNEIKTLFNIGVEKVCINTHAIENPIFIRKVVDIFGTQSIVVGIDIKKGLTGTYQVFTHSGTKKASLDPVKLAIKMEKMGAGELLINSIDLDGTMKGYDIELIRKISDAVGIPVIACGGAGKLKDLNKAVTMGHASAVAAGSMFVFQGERRGVLINFPTEITLKECFNKMR